MASQEEVGASTSRPFYVEIVRHRSLISSCCELSRRRSQLHGRLVSKQSRGTCGRGAWYLITAARQVITLMKLAPPHIVRFVFMDFTLAMNVEGRRWKGEDWKETCVQSDQVDGHKGTRAPYPECVGILNGITFAGLCIMEYIIAPLVVFHSSNYP